MTKPPDEAKLRKQCSRASEAARLQDSAMLQDFFEKVRVAVIGAITSSTPEQTDLRERAYYRLEALEDVKLCFTKTISDGKFAADELLRLDKERKT